MFSPFTISAFDAGSKLPTGSAPRQRQSSLTGLASVGRRIARPQLGIFGRRLTR